jgi:hypothetical protein
MQDKSGTLNEEGINGSTAKNLLTRLRHIIKGEGHIPDKATFGYLILQSDGFTTSWVKHKESKCWYTRVTVAHPIHNERSVFHTYYIVLEKGVNHHMLIIQKLNGLEDILRGARRYDGV